jgi:hypothetical protein
LDDNEGCTLEIVRLDPPCDFICLSRFTLRNSPIPIVVDLAVWVRFMYGNGYRPSTGVRNSIIPGESKEILGVGNLGVSPAIRSGPAGGLGFESTVSEDVGGLGATEANQGRQGKPDAGNESCVSE